MIQPSDLTTAPQFAARLGLPLHMFHAHYKRGKLVLPAPLMRANEGDRGAFIWRTTDVDPYTRTVSWTDEAGNTKTGPYAVLAMQARARGVVVRGESFPALAAAPELDESIPVPTGDVLSLPNGGELQDLNFLATRRDQLGHDQFMPVNWHDDAGQSLGVRPLGDHADERRAHYGISEPNGNALDPSTPAPGR